MEELIKANSNITREDLERKLKKEVNDTLLAQQRQSLGITGEAIAQLYAKSIKFEDKLKEEIVFEGYEEIERVGREITQIAKIF
jgi:hypothetical protein